MRLQRRGGVQRRWLDGFSAVLEAVGLTSDGGSDEDDGSDLASGPIARRSALGAGTRARVHGDRRPAHDVQALWLQAMLTMATLST
eukprot:11171333-Lingulodinium_polyedra.AAC.1